MFTRKLKIILTFVFTFFFLLGIVVFFYYQYFILPASRFGGDWVGYCISDNTESCSVQTDLKTKKACLDWWTTMLYTSEDDGMMCGCYTKCANEIVEKSDSSRLCERLNEACLSH